jgi:uncharacterized protein YecE (DUF72 family)
MKIWIGTSGFQYPAWKGSFYPEKMPVSKMLPFYATQFLSTEVNYSFRQIPSAKTIQNWAQATPDSFRFSFKAPQRITHFAKLAGCEEILGVFNRAIAGMGDKLGMVLFQLPPNFAKDVPLLSDFLDAMPEGMRAAFEFRHPSWFGDDVMTLLRAKNTALCIAENEELATPPEVTADFGYLRLRREDYSKADIKKWAKFVFKQESRLQETFIYFKHEDTAIGTIFAKQMQAELAALR